jgi:hypothetical protein
VSRFKAIARAARSGPFHDIKVGCGERTICSSVAPITIRSKQQAVAARHARCKGGAILALLTGWILGQDEAACQEIERKNSATKHQLGSGAERMSVVSFGAMRNTTFPLMLIVFGAAWLAHEAGWFGEWHSLIAIALIIIGIAIPVAEGINRQSIVAGPMLVYCGAAWLAYLHDTMSERIVWPLGVVVWGALLLVSRSAIVPARGRTRRRAGIDGGGPPTPPL